jgi:hypothetical protein
MISLDFVGCEALLGSTHQEGPGIAHCPACQCICSTSKDFADHMLGGDSLTHAQASAQHKIYDQQQVNPPSSGISKNFSTFWP